MKKISIRPNKKADNQIYEKDRHERPLNTKFDWTHVNGMWRSERASGNSANKQAGRQAVAISKSLTEWTKTMRSECIGRLVWFPWSRSCTWSLWSPECRAQQGKRSARLFEWRLLGERLGHLHSPIFNFYIYFLILNILRESNSFYRIGWLIWGDS